MEIWFPWQNTEERMKNAALFTSFSDLIKKIDQQGQGIVAAAAQPAEDVE